MTDGWMARWMVRGIDGLNGQMDGWVVGGQMGGRMNAREDGWLETDRSVGGWVDTRADGRAGNKSLACQDPSSLPSQPSPPLPFSQTWLSYRLTVTSDGGCRPGGLWSSGSLTVHLTENWVPPSLPRGSLSSLRVQERRGEAGLCHRL